MERNNYRIRVLLRLLLPLFSAAAAPPLFAWSHTVSASGNNIVVDVSGLNGQSCCAGVAVDDPNFTGGGSSCSTPCPGWSHLVLSCNAIGAHVVTTCVFDVNTGMAYDCKQDSVTVIDPPSPSCPQFDFVARSFKVLTHQYSDSYSGAVPYPSGQSKDGEITISLRTRAALPGTDIYIKVIDPEDGAAYGTPHQKDDNVDTSAGTIDGGGKTTTVQLPQPGTTKDLTLKITSYASGDNYQVQASPDPKLISDPNFVCSTSAGCVTTSSITAWKRMYVEMDEMYRNSQLVASRSLVGDSVVYVNSSAFRKGDNVRLIHAPSFSRAADYDVDGFYQEDRQVTAVTRNRNANQPGSYAITLDQPLTRPYFVDTKLLTTQLGDAIVNVSSAGADPHYQATDQYLANAFAEASVEIVKASTSGIGFPFYSPMTQNDMTYVGGKWFAARENGLTPSNFGLTVAAAVRAPVQNPNEVSLGTTGGAYSYVWRQTIDTATSGSRKQYPLLSGLSANNVSGEVLVHEVAHQWNVNSASGGHCTKMSYANPAKYCQMNSPQNSGQYDDGLIKFHYDGNSPASADSEYMTIRKTGEPKP